MNCCRYSPDGKTIVTASGDGTLRIWDPASGQQMCLLSGHADFVNACDYSPDGEKIVSCASDRTLRIWDLRLARSSDEPVKHRDFVTAGCFSRDGRYAVSASWDATVRLWDGETGAAAGVLYGHEDEVYDCTISPDGRQIASVSWDGRLNLWRSKGTNLMRQEIRKVRKWMNSCPFSPDGRFIATGGPDGRLWIWDVRSGRKLATLRGHRYDVRNVHWSPDSQQLLSESSDAVKLWDIPSAREVICLRASDGDANDEQLGRGHVDPFSPDGTRVVIVEPGNVLRVLDTNTGGEIAVFTGHRGRIRTFAFSRDGSHVLSASDDRTIRLWDVSSGELSALMDGHQEWVKTAVLSPDCKLVASSSPDKSLRVWDAASGRQVAIFWSESSFRMIDWRPDGHALIAGDGTGRVNLLSVESRDIGSPVETVWRAPDGALAVRCLHCESYPFHIISGDALGQEWTCPISGRMLRLNSFTINADWHPVAKVWRGE